MQASAGSTSNQSNIINVKNYRLGAEYYGGKWVKHLYIFNTDTDFCYNYTFQPNKKNYFVCFKCKKINKKRTVSATIASNENGEKYVQLNENEHVCERQKFELKTIIYEPDFKLDTVKVRGKEIQHLFVSDSNDKTLYYIYTLISGAKSYRCNNCQNIHNIHVRAYLLIDENGKQCCVLNAQKHKCRPQKL
uniref:Uncharacterized protein n=1 Tax=Panagrolaimus davidi TaxID=227884 RepID=A0A914P9E0_9BILA